MGRGRIGGVQLRGANTGACLWLCMVVVVVGVVARADHSSQRLVKDAKSDPPVNVFFMNGKTAHSHMRVYEIPEIIHMD